jgi:hypothetical protein
MKRSEIKINFEQGPTEKERKQFGNGKCLSMHQPWASLLVAGIKQVEGRSWESTFGGEWLWIHAASQVPTPELIEEVEASYRERFPAEKFPKKYPVSCMLGRVWVAGQLSKEEYQAIDFDEDNDSDYVFLCSAFEPLTLPIRASGDHKIWKLPPSLRATMKRAVQ